MKSIKTLRIGDVLPIEGKEYMIRYINEHNMIWFEPVVMRLGTEIITAGINKIVHANELREIVDKENEYDE